MSRRPQWNLQTAVGLTLSLVLGSCGGDTVEDGPILPAGAPLGLSEVPVLVVGERPDDADHEFFRVVTPFLVPDGGIGVPLSNEGAIRVFDGNGELVRTLGSSGQGPGEFMGLAAAWARGDTIEALDGELNRVTRFVPGEAPETILLEGVASAQSGVPALDDGSWVRYGVKEVQRTGRDLVAVHHFAPDGSHVAELGEIYGFRRHVHDGGSGPDPISPRPLVRTDGHRVYMAETLTPRIDVFDASTGESSSLQWEPEHVLSHAEAVAVAREQVSDAGRRQMDEAWTLASFSALTGSEEVPEFWDFLVDGGEFVWVRAYDPRVHATNVGGLMSAGPGGSWSVFDLDGNHVTSVALPEDFEPMSIDSDHLIGVRRDDLGVESVRVYRIERSGS
jgi:hypothetical protein